ncbi:SagB/ThcOx family dehydrogenase [Elusimicrobiota bacterium]
MSRKALRLLHLRLRNPVKVPRIIRSPNIAVYWEKDKLICEEYLKQIKIEASPSVIEILDHFSSPKRDFSGLHKGHIGLKKAAGKLMRLGFLNAYMQADKSMALDKWHWGHAAKYFLFSTKNANIAASKKIRSSYVKGLYKSSLQPSLYKNYTGVKSVKLEKPRCNSQGYSMVLGVRDASGFTKKAISKEDLSRFLFAVWGEQGKTRTKAFGDLLIKTSRSAGYRHPIEAYVVAINVSGVVPGLYHYNVKKHVLDLIKKGDFARTAYDLGCKQKTFFNAPCYIVMAAMIDRTMWKYRHEQGLRFLFLDAGHLSQMAYITARSLGLGLFTTFTVRHSKAEKLFKLDPYKETVLTLTAVGVEK